MAEEEGAPGRDRSSILVFQFCSRLSGVLGLSFFLLGLALLICEMRTTSHPTSPLSVIQATLTDLLCVVSGAETDGKE